MLEKTEKYAKLAKYFQGDLFLETIHAGFSGGMSVFLPLPSLPLGLFLPHIHIMGTRMLGLRQKAKGKKRRKEKKRGCGSRGNPHQHHHMRKRCEWKETRVLLTSSPYVFRGWFRLLLFSFSLFSSSSASAYLCIIAVSPSPSFSFLWWPLTVGFNGVCSRYWLFPLPPFLFLAICFVRGP